MTAITKLCRQTVFPADEHAYDCKGYSNAAWGWPLKVNALFAQKENELQICRVKFALGPEADSKKPDTTSMLST